jgi:CBS domain containing-hemolysin-like protein
MTVGSRAEVFHGTADNTAGGLTKKDLMKDSNDGRIKSKAAQQAALARMKKEGKKAMVKVFKPKKSGFKLQPKAGTVEYEKKIAKMQ